jgi:hypothetical protein
MLNALLLFVKRSTGQLIVVYLEALLEVISKGKRLRKPRNVARKGQIITAHKIQVYMLNESENLREEAKMGQ